MYFKSVFFFQKVQFIFQISKSPKNYPELEIQNSRHIKLLLWVGILNFQFRIVFRNIFWEEIWRFEKRIPLSEKKPPLGWMKVQELFWPHCVHLYLTLWHQYIPCVFPIPLKTSNIRTQYVLGLIFDPIYISMWALERAIIYLQPGLKLGSYFYVLFIESVGLSNLATKYR